METCHHMKYQSWTEEEPSRCEEIQVATAEVTQDQDQIQDTIIWDQYHHLNFQMKIYQETWVNQEEKNKRYTNWEVPD